MLQLDVPLCRIGGNAAYRVRRYGHLLVTSEFISNVKETSPRRILDSDCLGPSLQPDISNGTHVAYTTKQICLRRISAFLPPASWGVSKGGLL